MVSAVDKNAVFNNLVDGVFVCSKDGDILESNPALASILGYEVEAIRTKNVSRDLVERILEWKALISLIEQGSVISDYEIKFRRQDGGTVNASISASMLRDANGETIGLAVVLRDITTRRGVENELRDKVFRTDIINKIAKLAGTEGDIRKRALVNITGELRKLINFDLLTVGISEDNGRHVDAPRESSFRGEHGRGAEVRASGNRRREGGLQEDIH